MSVSKTQIDRLGNRLKESLHTESDLRLLDDYRRSFGVAYEAVVRTIRQRGEFPTGRLAKSTISIVEKLRRESIRLSQMQDIAGCRVVVGNVVEQEQLVAVLRQDFPEASVIDRRDNPSHGYRAIHIIVEVFGKPIEIQVRSALQHLWAEVSEKSSDVLDPAIKYGGGSDSWRNFLSTSSQRVAFYEVIEKRYYRHVTDKQVQIAGLDQLEKAIREQLRIMHRVPYREPNNNAKEVMELQGRQVDMTHTAKRIEEKLEELRKTLVDQRNANIELLTGAISWLDELKRQKP